MGKKKKRTGLSPEWHERHERNQRLLLERIAYPEAKLEEARTGVPVEPKIRVPTSEEARKKLRARIADRDARLREERGESQTG
jgi:hypothetical protein